MPTSAAKDPRQALGRNPDRLTLVERTALAGKMIALEVYSPATLPLRRIEAIGDSRSEEHTSELQSPMYLVCRLLLEKKKKKKKTQHTNKHHIIPNRTRRHHNTV